MPKKSIVINKGGDTIAFSDINIGDNVTVKYKAQSSGVLEASGITVEYHGDFPT